MKLSAWLALSRKLSQIAADRVLRKSELGAHFLGDDPPVRGETGKEKLLSLLRQHCTNLHDLARFVTI